MTTVLVIVLWLLAATLVVVLIVLGANRELRERQDLLVEMLGAAHREIAKLTMAVRYQPTDEAVVERYLETL